MEILVPCNLKWTTILKLMKVKQENEKAGLKLSIQKANIMAPGPITSWQIEEGKGKAVTDFIFLGFKITVDDDCSHKMKRCLFLGGKAMTNLDSVLKKKQGHHFPDKGQYSQSCSFSSSCVWM